ncbi:MAG: PilT/PilU family type 4a pilus ATPase [Chloroflexi bacterium]|nr:PilT/PilU family type 4a pilus ATPase [Chloroflexota bacterium]
MNVMTLLELAKIRGASDLHLIAGSPPLMRINGLLQAVGDRTLSGEDIAGHFTSLTSVKQREEFDRCLELDFGYTLPGIARLRCNAAQQQGTISLVIRLLPMILPGIDALSLPPVYKQLIMNKRGLIIISGPTGSGKSTSLAAMISYLNNIESRRIVTIEDPIEYVYSGGKCTITQRELGIDTLSYAEALKHVLRQDPDVILVGEVRDLETVSTVLTMAETGHLVLTTGHAPSTYQAVERIIDLFPPHERQMTQSRLASLLVAVCCQNLVPKAEGTGRVAAVEVMLANAAVRNLIRDGKTFQLPNVIRTHISAGMQLMDQSLLALHRQGIISSETLLEFSQDQKEVLKASTAEFAA